MMARGVEMPQIDPGYAGEDDAAGSERVAAEINQFPAMVKPSSAATDAKGILPCMEPITSAAQ